MDKTSSLLSKTLVIGVIFLFIGVGIQPAFAITSNTSNNEDDCNLCAKKISKSQLIRLRNLIEKLDTLNTKLSVVSKLNPKIMEKYQELSNKITTLTELNKDIKPDEPLDDFPYPIICSILAIIAIFTFTPGVIAIMYYEEFRDNYPILSLIFTLISSPFILPIIIAGLVFYYIMVINWFFIFKCQDLWENNLAHYYK